MPRSSPGSGLQTWVLYEQRGSDEVVIECPHCEQAAKVYMEPWLYNKADYVARPCTYCFKTSKIPEET